VTARDKRMGPRKLVEGKKSVGSDSEERRGGERDLARFL